jgi:hypothetical protein
MKTALAQDTEPKILRSLRFLREGALTGSTVRTKSNYTAGVVSRSASVPVPERVHSNV